MSPRLVRRRTLAFPSVRLPLRSTAVEALRAVGTLPRAGEEVRSLAVGPAARTLAEELGTPELPGTALVRTPAEAAVLVGHTVVPGEAALAIAVEGEEPRNLAGVLAANSAVSCVRLRLYLVGLLLSCVLR